MTDPTRRHDRWYERSFGELYPLLYGHRDSAAADAETDGLLTLLDLPADRTGRASLKVLDICCGAGRHLAAFRQRGFDAWGLDLSATLLARAARRPGLAGRLVRANVLAVPFERCFDLAVNLFSSFGYFRADPDNRLALQEMAEALRPRGRLVMDHINRSRLTRELVPESRRRVRGLQVVQRRRIDGDRVVKHITVCGEGSPREFVEDVRIYHPEEITALFGACGFTEVQVYGDFDGAPFGEDAPRMIVVGRRI